MKRSYRLGKRAEAAAATRRRIVMAALELAGSVGPRAASIAEIARMAKVERLTVYTHFPDESGLWSEVWAAWLARHPRPDLEALAAMPDPWRRLLIGLDRLYGWYDASAAVTGRVEQDGPAMPGLAPVLAEAAGYRAQLQQVVETGWVPTPWSAATLRAGLSFATWESLCGGSGLAGDEAAALVVAWVRAA